MYIKHVPEHQPTPMDTFSLSVKVKCSRPVRFQSYLGTHSHISMFSIQMSNLKNVRTTLIHTAHTVQGYSTTCISHTHKRNEYIKHYM
jgi:hypothetical protein